MEYSKNKTVHGYEKELSIQAKSQLYFIGQHVLEQKELKEKTYSALFHLYEFI